MSRGRREAGRFPWKESAPERAVFCTLWTTGPDTAIDGVFRMQARRRDPATGAWKELDRLCTPFSENAASGDAGAATARMAREYGITGADLAGAPPAAEAFEELRRFLGESPVVALDAEVLESWLAHLAGSREGLPPVVGLVETTALLFPGRLANRREDLVRDLLPAAPDAIGPVELQGAWTEIAARFLEQDGDVLQLFVLAVERAWEGLSATDPRAADRLASTLDLVDRPSAWMAREGLLPFRKPPIDGELRARAGSSWLLEQLVERVAPRCAAEGGRWSSLEPLPPDTDDEKPFAEEDLRRLDDVFEVHLPAIFAQESGAAPQPRASQHAVARSVAEALGARELLLVHAPTGTGKTLAYLVPALLWARRHGIRVGVATYTRALQEQAMDRDVPRALAALARAGVPSGLRITVLKGRENYLCWRALKNALPSEDDDGETWLAWTALCLFALTDGEGDLDRLPQRPPLLLAVPARYQRSFASMQRAVHAETGCCTHRQDRETCAADVARRKAERSHVVIANQAFVLSRQEFFRHLVFDECEHLHEVAHNTWSHATTLRALRGLLERLHQPERESARTPLDRLSRALVEGTPAHGDAEAAILAWERSREALEHLVRAVGSFQTWREQAARMRSDADGHSLLREFVATEDSAELVASRAAFVERGNELEASLAALSARLEEPLVRGAPRVRRSLELARIDLARALGTLESWMPLEEGRPAFRAQTFHDVETDFRGETALVARVLLPNEYLGRRYYPEIGAGVFLSATTWLQESFEPALRYLGLDRTARPAESEERPPRAVRTFRAPEVFDYARVLVAVPRDAPAVNLDKGAFLDYVRRFLAHLGERTRGRILCLFTNAQDAKQVGQELAGFFRARRIPLWFQNMEGSAKEELSELFRARVDSILLGVDTFWFGADFPGETLEYLVIVKLPYGVPDRYHHAQCAALGTGEQRRTVYLPRALAKFRQGFGRLMRKESDKGCVFVLDGRVLDPRHRFFLKELPLERDLLDRAAGDGGSPRGARFVRGDTERCIREALAHMDMLADVRRRGLEWSFSGDEPAPSARPERAEPPEILDIPLEDVPF